MKLWEKILLTNLIWCLLASNPTALSQGTAFSYQGRLVLESNPASGVYDISFALFDTNTGGQPLSATNKTGIPMANGLFTVELDFGTALSFSNNWLEVSVRSNNFGTYTTLSPRQQITPAPSAIFAGSAKTAEKAAAIEASGILGTLNASQLPDKVSFGFIQGSNFAGDGSGLSNLVGVIKSDQGHGTNNVFWTGASRFDSLSGLPTNSFPVIQMSDGYYSGNGGGNIYNDQAGTAMITGFNIQDVFGNPLFSFGRADGGFPFTNRVSAQMTLWGKPAASGTSMSNYMVGRIDFFSADAISQANPVFMNDSPSVALKFFNTSHTKVRGSLMLEVANDGTVENAPYSVTHDYSKAAYLSDKGRWFFGNLGNAIDDAEQVRSNQFQPKAWVHVRGQSSKTPAMVIEAGILSTSPWTNSFEADGRSLYYTDFQTNRRALLMSGAVGDAHEFTNLNAASLNGVLRTENLPGITTNLSVPGATFYITNGLIMRVTTP